MQLIALVALLLAPASGFAIGACPRVVSRAGVSMQILAPERVAVPDTLPSTWRVPDTFSLSSLQKAPMFKLTVFKSGRNVAHVSDALVDVVPGMSKVHSSEVAETAYRVGFSLVGLWEQELAEEYAAELKKDHSLVCDVSAE